VNASCLAGKHDGHPLPVQLGVLLVKQAEDDPVNFLKKKILIKLSFVFSFLNIFL
jgi:hypothetical protein